MPLMILGAMTFAAPCLVAQQTEAAPAFEVATIKPGSQDRMGILSTSPEDFRVYGLPVEAIIGFAYDIPWMRTMTVKQAPPFQASSPNLLGGPDWVRSETFDVSAKADEAVIAAWSKLPPQQQKEQIELMVRALLADRFKLQMRNETEVIPVYALVVTKDGPKFKPTPPEPPADPNAPAKPYQSPWKFDVGMIEGHGVTMDGLMTFLWAQPELGSRKIIDRTGLKGQYDLTLKWASERDPSEEATGPSLFSAIQDQLGLKLESTKAPSMFL